MFREHKPSSAQVYLPHGQVPAPGSRFSNPQLAVTYQRVLDEAEAAAPGRDEQIEAARRIFYEGCVTVPAMTRVMTGPGCTALPPRGRLWCHEVTASAMHIPGGHIRRETS